jgi:hypothetical protein
MIVDVNTKDFYPEYPQQFVAKRRKLIMNVWRKGRKVDRNFIANVCSGDIDHDGFDLSLIIKDAHAVNAVKDTIRSNWKVFY